jgi:hypothetical protein
LQLASSVAREDYAAATQLAATLRTLQDADAVGCMLHDLSAALADQRCVYCVLIIALTHLVRAQLCRRCRPARRGRWPGRLVARCGCRRWRECQPTRVHSACHAGSRTLCRTGVHARLPGRRAQPHNSAKGCFHVARPPANCPLVGALCTAGHLCCCCACTLHHACCRLLPS